MPNPETNREPLNESDGRILRASQIAWKAARFGLFASTATLSLLAAYHHGVAETREDYGDIAGAQAAQEERDAKLLGAEMALAGLVFMTSSRLVVRYMEAHTPPVQ